MSRLVAILLLSSGPALADTHGRLWLEAAGGWEARWLGGEDANEFTLGRAELGGRVDFAPWLYAELMASSVRSVEGQSQFGVDGDALLLRVQRACLGFRAVDGDTTWVGQAGLIPHGWLSLVESTAGARGAGRTLTETSAFLDPADLGVSLGAAFWGGHLELSVWARNGEGYSQVELDASKNVGVWVAGRPWIGALGGEPASVVVGAGYEDGTLGVGSAADRRVLGLVGFGSVRAFAHVEAGYAIGFRGDGARDAAMVSVEASGEPIDGFLGLLGRFDWVDADLDAEDAREVAGTVGLYTDVLAGVGLRRLGRARVYVTYRYARNGEDASPLAALGELLEEHRFEVRVDVLGAVTFGGR